jgi:U32 family peptidase
MKTPELLAPGGSFLSAFYALEAGADGVYLGLREFSARASAKNFSFDQLRRIRQLAADRNRRVYVTLNTLVTGEEIPRLVEALSELAVLRVDGVIVQDLGVLEILRRRFPAIPILASTQMAVHNDAGIAWAERMGIRRVILARELPLETIRVLRERHPGIELEVFIHGALCYSFSGACLASSALTGRSGNRGDCAQICRSLFQAEASGLDIPESGHFFSCRDLFLGREVLSLARIGVDSLKIEGRMKSPEYVFNVTRLYRAILDKGEGLSDAEYDALVRNVELSFAREKTTGWLRASAGSRLIQSEFPGHRGALLGNVEAVTGRDITVRLQGDLSVRDGIGFFVQGEREPAAFSVQRVRVSGSDVKFARAGTLTDIEVPSGLPLPRKGDAIRHLSSRFLDLPQPREAGFPLYSAAVDLKVRLDASGGLTVSAAGFPDFSTTVTVDAARRKKRFLDVIEPLLRESGDSLFRTGACSFENATERPEDGIFVPPSELKRAKNDLFAFLQDTFRSRIASDQDAGASVSCGPSPLGQEDQEALAHRERLNPPGGKGIPFVSLPGGIVLSDAAELAGFRWLPLPPVMLEDASWIESLQKLADENPDKRIAVGLNNVGHLGIASLLASKPNIWFFIDFSLYVANAHTLSLVCARVPRLLFAYAWLEGKEGEALSARTSLPVLEIAPGFRAPLFTSLGCFARHVGNAGRCFDECPKDFTADVRQGRNKFSVVVRDCVTYLFARSGVGGSSPA